MADEGADTDTPDAQPAIPEKPADVQFGEDSFNSDITLQETNQPCLAAVGMLARAAGVETDRAGRVPVEPDCTLPGHPEVFAIGDMVSLNKVPGMAQSATGGHIRRKGNQGPEDRGDGEALRVLRQGRDGDHRVSVRRRRRLRDEVHPLHRLLMWAFIHVFDLIGWGSRLGTLYTWACGIWFRYNRAHCIITFDSAKKDAVGPPPVGRPIPVLSLSATAAAAPSGTPTEGVAAP